MGMELMWLHGGTNCRANVSATNQRNEVPVDIPFAPPPFFCKAVIDACAKSSAAEVSNSSVSEPSRQTWRAT